jgi:TolB protein
MTDRMPSPEFEEKIRGAISAPEADAKFVNGLRSRLIETAAQKKARRARFFPRPAWQWVLTVLVVLLIAFFAIGPQRVVAAMQKIFGYIPNVGMVDQSSPIRVLAEPVKLERDGYTMTVESAVVDSQRTVITFSVEGISIAAANAGGEGAANCMGMPSLLLPTGTTLGWTDAQSTGWGTGYREQLISEPLPLDVNEATLTVPCISDMPPGGAPENWQFALRFVPAPPDMTVMPVIDITPSPDETGAGSGSATEALFGISVTLEKAIQSENGYILIGHIASTDARIVVHDPVFKVFDVTGQEIPSQYVDLYTLGMDQATFTQGQWALEVQGYSFAAPLTLRAVSVYAELATPVSVPFNPGANLQEGQEIPLNQTLDVLGYPVRLISARYIVTGDMHGFEISAQVPPELESPGLGLEGIVGGNAGGGGGGPADENGVVTITTVTNGSLDGLLSLTLTNVVLKGSWDVNWTPPVSDETDTPVPAQPACLTLDAWKQVRTSNLPLPSDLTGTLLTMRGALAPDASLFLSALDGSNTRPLVFGYGSLSPDGTRLVYSDSADAINILDLTTDLDTMLDPAAVQARQVVWSPDGQMIAYDRFTDTYNVYVMNADGSNPRPLTFPPGMQFIEGWTPDSKQVLVSNLGDGGTMLMLVDVATGATTNLFTVTSKGAAGAAISPDGQWIAFVDRSFGEMAGGVFLSRLDGSERRPIVQLDYWPAISPIWSPDGKWLAISILDGDVYDTGNAQIALVNVSTCEVIPLHGVEGEVRSWRP